MLAKHLHRGVVAGEREGQEDCEGDPACQKPGLNALLPDHVRVGLEQEIGGKVAGRIAECGDAEAAPPLAKPQSEIAAGDAAQGRDSERGDEKPDGDVAAPADELAIAHRAGGVGDEHGKARRRQARESQSKGVLVRTDARLPGFIPIPSCPPGARTALPVAPGDRPSGRGTPFFVDRLRNDFLDFHVRAEADSAK